MRRLVLILTVLPAGCLAPTLYPAGTPPQDGDATVRVAVGKVALKAITDATAGGAGWVPHRCLHGEGGGFDYRWHTQFACQKPADAPSQGPVWRFPEEGYVGVLSPVRAAVVTAVETTGVEVLAATPVEFTGGAEPVARFEVRYLRRGGEVAGVVEGAIRPAGGKADADTRYTDVAVTAREWYVQAVNR